MLRMSAGSPLGCALREQRDALGCSAERLAALSELPVDRVIALEQGAQATTREIAKLASALAVDPAALWRGEVSLPRTTARFRAPSGVASLAEGDARLLARAAEAGRVLAHLRSLRGEEAASVVARRRVSGVAGWPEPWDQGYRLGARLRADLGPGKAPIPSVQRLLEEHGVHVAWSAFESGDVIAASLYEPGAAPVILLNTRSPRARARLSRRAVLAHELCHLVVDGGETDLLTLVSRGVDATEVEQRANGFAPSFIVPGGWISPHTTDVRQLALDVATEWGLSFEGALWHLKNAQHIGARDVEEELRREAVVIPEGAFEGDIERREPAHLRLDVTIGPLAYGALSDVTLGAFEADMISRGRAVEILALA